MKPNNKKGEGTTGSSRRAGLDIAEMVGSTPTQSTNLESFLRSKKFGLTMIFGRHSVLWIYSKKETKTKEMTEELLDQAIRGAWAEGRKEGYGEGARNQALLDADLIKEKEREIELLEEENMEMREQQE